MQISDKALQKIQFWGQKYSHQFLTLIFKTIREILVFRNWWSYVVKFQNSELVKACHEMLTHLFSTKIIVWDTLMWRKFSHQFLILIIEIAQVFLPKYIQVCQFWIIKDINRNYYIFCANFQKLYKKDMKAKWKAQPCKEGFPWSW